MKSKIKYILFSIMFLLLINIVSAYYWQCFDRGEVIPGGTTCAYDCCKACMSNSGYTTQPQYCSGLSDCSCDGSGTPQVDSIAISINSPIEGVLYYSGRVQLDVTLNKVATSLSYKLDSGGYTPFCTNCNSASAQVPSTSMQDGQHTLIVKAEDGINVVTKTVHFKTDKTAPVIEQILPNNGVYETVPVFSVTYTEQNLQQVKLYYKSTAESEYHIQTLSGCSSGTSVTCSVNPDLSGYADNTEIQFYFNVADGNFNTNSNTNTITLNTGSSGDGGEVTQTGGGEDSPVVNGYQLRCFENGETMPGDTICNYDCCQMCVTELGYSTLPQNCAELSCSCDGEITPPIDDINESNCTEDWQCTDWGACQSSNTQTRTCTDANNCGTTTTKPAESQSCTYSPSGSPGGGSPGGGGGSGSSTFTVTDEGFQKGHEGKLGLGDKFKFNVSGNSHTLRLGQVNTNEIKITIQSIVINEYMKEGEERNFDLDEDGTLDLYVKIVDIDKTKNEALILIKQYVESAGEEQEEIGVNETQGINQTAELNGTANNETSEGLPGVTGFAISDIFDVSTKNGILKLVGVVLGIAILVSVVIFSFRKLRQ